MCERQEVHCVRVMSYIVGETVETLWERWEIYCGRYGIHIVRGMGGALWE